MILFFFLEISTEQAKVLKESMDEFCKYSSQKVSNAKTRVFFSKIVGGNKRMEIYNLPGFSVNNYLGKYLVVPLLHKKVDKQTYGYIVEKVSSKLSS